MNKFTKTMIISLLLILSMPMAKLSAQVSTWDGTWEPWTHGTGTEADPFLIENARQLAYLAYRVNNGLDAGGGHVSNHDYHYKLMVDVDLNGSEDFQWTPIGYWNSDTDYQCFGGQFDGNGHVISGLYINSAANRVGFFCDTDGAGVRTLGIRAHTVATTGKHAGGVIGLVKNTTIDNCYVIGSVVTNGGNINSGGIVGYVYSGSNTITNCYHTGNVLAECNSNNTSCGGGIVGCVNQGTLIVTNCYNTGNVTATGINNNSRCSGGIVGCVNTGTINITNCYNTGIVTASGNNYYSYSGGIIGNAAQSSLTIKNCYNVGSVTANFGGGIVGQSSNGSVTNSYYLNTCGGSNTYGGQPMSADAMQSAEFVTILNAGSLTYKKDNQPYVNQGYPIFSGFNIETRLASAVELTSAVLNGSYTSGIFNITSQGFEYKKTTDQSYTTVNCTAGQTPYSYELSNLESGATYQYRAYVMANEGTAYGELMEFTTATVNTHQIYVAVYDFTSGPGIVTPSGYINVADGEDLTIEISPIEHSVLDSVRVDGVNIGVVTSYTFHNVTEDHYIHAHFSLISTPDYQPWDGVTTNEPFHYDNYYYICSPTELAWVAQMTNISTLLLDKIICLMNNIDLGGAQSVPSSWTPIGTSSHPFRGTFYGHGKSIYNLWSNNTGGDNIGLFGYAEESRIYHTQLRNANVTGKTNVGGIIGYAKHTRLAMCNVTGQILGTNNVGGLAGTVENIQPYNQGRFWGCYANVEIEADENAGGLFGIIQGNNADHCYIKECFSTGIVRSQNVSGGLIGTVNLSNNENILDVSRCYSNATVIGSKSGGLIGCRSLSNNNYLGELIISNSYVSGSVKNGFGFIGTDNNATGSIATCSNCFFDSQSTGCGDNGIAGISSKTTNEMTTAIGFGLGTTTWLYNNGLYPQLNMGYFFPDWYEGLTEMAQLSVSPIFLQNNENSSAVHSNFQVSTANGVTWSSSNPDAIAINGSYASVNTMIDETVTLTATLDGISKQINVTVGDPNTYLIYQPSDLRFIAEQCNAGETFEGKCIKLMNDIVLPENVPNNMISIGSYPNRPFKGTFDGNEKLIYNLYIDQPNTPYQGFFGYTLNANLYNVGLVNITASGRNYTGGMVAYAKNTYMRDCYVNGGTLFALSYCGGLVGYQEQGTNSIISGCYNTCEVTGNNYVGGLIGFSNYSTVRNSYVAGRVAAQGEPVGAIIGGANEVLMYYCYFSTELTGQTVAIGENNFKDGGEGLTNAQMRDPQFVNTLNQNLVTPVWMADYASHINNGFPIIKWQRPGTGVEEHDAVKSCISLYPNPANSFVTIQSDELNVLLKQVEVYDVMGRKVLSEVLDGKSQNLNIAKLFSGVYHVRVQTSNGCYTNLKLVVQ